MTLGVSLENTLEVMHLGSFATVQKQQRDVVVAHSPTGP